MDYSSDLGPSFVYIIPSDYSHVQYHTHVTVPRTVLHKLTCVVLWTQNTYLYVCYYVIIGSRVVLYLVSPCNRYERDGKNCYNGGPTETMSNRVP